MALRFFFALLLLPMWLSSVPAGAQESVSAETPSAVTPSRGPREQTLLQPGAQAAARGRYERDLVLERRLRRKRRVGGAVLGIGLLSPAVAVTAGMVSTRNCADEGGFCGFGAAMGMIAVSAGSVPLVIAGAVVLGVSSRRLRALEASSPAVVGLPGGAGLAWRRRF